MIISEVFTKSHRECAKGSAILKISIVASIAAGVFIWITGEYLPSNVASHFDSSGSADSFMKRSSYLSFMISVVCVITLLTGVLSRLIPAIPNELINLPDKSFWLSPERRVESLNYISNWLQWFSVGIASFLCYVHWLVVQANINQMKQLDSGYLYAGLVVMLLVAIAEIAALIARFRK